MLSKKLFCGLAASALVAAGAVAAAGTATASTTETAASGSGSTVTVHHLPQQKSSAAGWSAERMLNAVGESVLAEKAAERWSAQNVLRPAALDADNAPLSIPGTAPSAPAAVAPAAEAAPSAANENPVPHIGKVFFTLGGQDYVCSGNSVVSGNDSVVSTAGHCLNEGPGSFASEFVFVPAYENGSAPYGQWPAETLYAPTAWIQQGDMSVDTAFAVLAEQGGQSLADAVGASGVQFNAPTGQQYTAYGYPAASPFNGQTLKSCSGTATPDSINPGFGTQGIPCDMTGGSSGGPWFINATHGGYQNSVNSYGYGGVNAMFGPRWANVIQDSYEAASQH
ncbi:trypsin-like serine peptidase [Zafaria sp. Z1313]|uniref:trypsin-like serine peptidase n=1 Tax=Zafaria sp. Z1313 TaxID=3423202 RepID=UPI003D303AF2